VLLYEVLTGHTPLDGRKLRAAGLDAFRRIVRETRLPSPSRRVGALSADEIRAVAECRASQPGELIQALHGGLDRVVMKSLEKPRCVGRHLALRPRRPRQ
jgi:hypothetical protein